MRAIFATASVALAFGEADHADVEEYLSLLQLSARPHSVAENSDDLNAHDVDDLVSAGVTSYPITWDTQRSFGPDGTWATPFCKNIQGCLIEERVCPAGCDGMAYWQPTNLANSRLGIAKPVTTFHFVGCIQGMNRGGGFGSWHVWNHMQNCNNGPDSKKPSFFQNIGNKDAAWVKQNIGNPAGGVDPAQTGYGQEWCPKECVNDCAQFKNGQYFTCGSTAGDTWFGYNGRNTRTGPSANCPVGAVRVLGTSSFTWCGEPTTTTTTTPPPPPPPPVEEPVDEPDDDEANAIGDPHLTSNTGHHFDLQ